LPLARIGSKILFFAHIPKTGGSSVESYLMQKGPLALKFQRRLNWSVTTTQHMNEKIFSRVIPDAFYDHSFTVVRDPMKRLISEYNYRSDRRGSAPDFDRWAKTVITKTKKNPFAFDNHIRPQVDFYREGMRLFRLESGLDAVFDWIDTVTETPTAERGVWDKKSRIRTIDPKPETQALVQKYYKDDFALWERAD
jgi:hypothetical protein